jgi:hypothetical protein
MYIQTRPFISYVQKILPPKIQIFSRLDFLEKRAARACLYPFYAGERAETQSMVVYTNGIWRHFRNITGIDKKGHQCESEYCRSLKLLCLWLLDGEERREYTVLNTHEFRNNFYLGDLKIGSYLYCNKTFKGLFCASSVHCLKNWAHIFSALTILR